MNFEVGVRVKERAAPGQGTGVRVIGMTCTGGGPALSASDQRANPVETL